MPKAAGSTFSNLFNDVHYYMGQDVSFDSLSSVALDNSSYNEIDNSILWTPDPSVQVSLGDSYLNHSSIFDDSNQVSLQLFYRMNEHWQFRARSNWTPSRATCSCSNTPSTATSTPGKWLSPTPIVNSTARATTRSTSRSP